MNQLLGTGRLANVGVLVYDSFDAIGQTKLVKGKKRLIEFGQRQAQSLPSGQCLVVINLVHRGSPGLGEQTALETWKTGLARELGQERVPEECFHIYRNSDSRRRMVLCRLLFDCMVLRV